MKRSDVVKRIEDSLDKGDAIYYSNTAEDILKSLEGYMIPKPKDLEIVNGRLLHYYVDDSIEASGIISEAEENGWVITNIDYLWEPEDDKTDT